MTRERNAGGFDPLWVRAGCATLIGMILVVLAAWLLGNSGNNTPTFAVPSVVIPTPGTPFPTAHIPPIPVVSIELPTSTPTAAITASPTPTPTTPPPVVPQRTDEPGSAPISTIEVPPPL